MKTVSRTYAKRMIKLTKKRLNHLNYKKRNLKKATKRVGTDIENDIKLIPKISKENQAHFIEYYARQLMRLSKPCGYIYIPDCVSNYDDFTGCLTSKKDICQELSGDAFSGEAYVYKVQSSGKHLKIMQNKYYLAGWQKLDTKHLKSRKITLSDLRNITDATFDTVSDKLFNVSNQIKDLKLDYKPLRKSLKKQSNVKAKGISEKFQKLYQNLRNLKADSLALDLHYQLYGYISKSDYRHINIDMNKLVLLPKPISVVNKFNDFCNCHGINNLAQAIKINQCAPTEASYEHMVSSYDVEKGQRDRITLAKLQKISYAKYVQGDGNAVDGPQPYDDSGVAPDTTATLKLLQPNGLDDLITSLMRVLKKDSVVVKEV